VFGVGRDLMPSQRFWILLLVATLPVLVSCWTTEFYGKHNSDIESWWLPTAMQTLWWAVGCGRANCRTVEHFEYESRNFVVMNDATGIVAASSAPPPNLSWKNAYCSLYCYD
jgi:hypothetical protein